MKVFFVLVVLLVSCYPIGSIHDADRVRQMNQMLKQDKRMKNKVQQARKRSTPKNLRQKVKRAKKIYI